MTLANGKLSTKNTYLDGAVAYVGINGSINLAKERYNLLLKVAPHITASVPIVALIAGGPIIGGITWVASKVINAQMKRVSSYTYKISGPWKSPKVEQLTIEPEKKRKSKQPPRLF